MLIYNMSRVVSIRMSDELLQRLHKYCRDNEIDVKTMGISNVCRGIIARFLKEKGY